MNFSGMAGFFITNTHKKQGMNGPSARKRDAKKERKIGYCLGISFLGLAVSGHAAQLSTFGQNKLQTNTGAAVQIVCGKMIPIQDTLVGDQKQLFDRCGELVQTGNSLTPDDQGPTGKSLDISADELAEALQQVAPEETEAMGAGLTDTSQDQLASLRNRLQFLRTGTSTMPIAGAHWSGGAEVGGTAGADGFSRMGAFITGVYAEGDKDAANVQNGVEDAFDYDAYGFTAGLDYRLTEQLILGAAFGYIQSNVDFDRNYGKTDSDNYSLALYSTWYQENFFLEGSVAYTEHQYDSERNIDYPNNNPDNPSMGQPIAEKVRSDTDGNSWSWSAGAGYNLAHNNQNYTFSATVNGLNADIDSYQESGSELAMAVGDQDVESLQSVLQAQAAFNFSQDFGVLIPFIGVAWHHEFEDDDRTITARYVFDPNNADAANLLSFTTELGDEDFYTLNLGTNLVLQNGNQVFFNYETVLDLEDVTSNVFTIGLRMEL